MPTTHTWTRPANWPATHESRWARPLTRLLMRVLSRYEVLGAENMPEPPFLLVSNHMSFFDIPAVHLPTPEGTVGMAAKKYKGSRLEPLFSLYSVIWVEQFSPDLSALRDAIAVLKGGAALAMAPEGTRSRSAQLIQGRAGAAFIATRADVLIVPVGVWGTERVLKHPRPKVTVRYGKPFRLPTGRAKGAQLEEYTERIMCAIAALLPSRYHGYYADHPRIEEMRALVC